MKITDEMLSAFLDAELEETAMEQVRCALEVDDTLVMRMADLAQADQWVMQHAAIIDNTKVSDDILQLAQAIDRKIAQQNVPEATENVVSLSRWQRINQNIPKPYALAAGVAMLFGVGTVTLMQVQQPSSGITASTARVLDHARSGEMLTTTQGDNITANLSFTNHAGDYCRQFQRQSEYAASVNIACKENTQWQLKVSEEVALADNRQTYRAASNNAVLDSAIDAMINGSAMDSKQEQQAIENKWQTNQK